MGIYLNPGNEGFQHAVNSHYVDKTGLIRYINAVLNTNYKLTCISRPRRFGKTTAAKMLCAYYDKSCDSRAMFDGTEITGDPSFEKHLNQYNVIYLDISWFISRKKSVKKSIEFVVTDIQLSVIRELMNVYPECIADGTIFLPDALAQINEQTGDRFFFIIDEWDALFREAKLDETVQKEYIQLLRGLFKGGTITDNTIIGAYMTGILPIKKYGTESALTDFREYTMVKPAKFAKYVGFTEDEVRALCDQYHMDFDIMEQWYDGYSFQKMNHVYSPNSVMEAILNEEYGNYWVKTESFKPLEEYISMNMNGLKAAVISMLGGQAVEIDTLGFQNDLVSMSSRDDVLTLLVHLGYLAFDSKNNTVYIPNLEVADSFKLAVRESAWTEVGDMIEKSSKLLKETIAGNSEYVAEALENVHQKTSSILQYNNENSLACAVTIAYYTARSDYEMIRELPAGKGFADLVFVPRKNSDKPAMIVELKYNQSAKTALQQIKDKEYAGALSSYTGTILLVGINYDKDKGHSCVIERMNSR